MAVNFCQFSQTFKHWENNSSNTLVWNTTAQLWGVLFREARMRFPVFNKSLEFLGTKYSRRKRAADLADLPHNLFMWNTLNTKQYHGLDYTTTHAVNIKLWSAHFSNDSMSVVCPNNLPYFPTSHERIVCNRPSQNQNYDPPRPMSIYHVCTFHPLPTLVFTVTNSTVICCGSSLQGNTCCWFYKRKRWLCSTKALKSLCTCATF